MNAVLKQGSPLMLDHTAVGSPIAAGDVVVIGGMVAMAHRDIAVGQLGALGSGGGVYRMPKATGVSTGIANRALVYWDAANKVATTDDDSGANKLIGHADGASADADTHLDVVHHSAVYGPDQVS